VNAVERLRIPIWREGRLAGEHLALLRDPSFRNPGIQVGDGAPVLLIPGFLAGDPTLRVMAGWLRRSGYEPCRAGMRANVDCSGRALERLERQLERKAAKHGRRVTIIGHSRGGTMARVLAVRRPDLVDRIICLGAPLTDQLAIHPLVHAQVLAVGLLGTLRVPGFFSKDCLNGDCCAVANEQLLGSFPDDVGFTSIYSKSDGIVDWTSCLDPAARQVEVDSSHCGMALNSQVFRAIAGELPTLPAYRRAARAVSSSRAARRFIPRSRAALAAER
jgi:pimeloyl-ACP methyl ester carboxylesterase